MKSPLTRRLPAAELMPLARRIATSEVGVFSDALPQNIFILNEFRQILHVNKAALALAGTDEVQDVVGLRPGEFLNCIHSSETEAGCGTTDFCSQCGALDALTSTRQGVADRVCSMLRKESGRIQALNLSISCALLEMDGRTLKVFTVTDISRDVRRRTLERLFFHDVLNLAGGLSGMMQLLTEDMSNLDQETAEALHTGLAFLVEEIRSQQVLAAAESDQLEIHLGEVLASEVLKGVASTYLQHQAARGKGVEVAPDAEEAVLWSDRSLVIRSLGNLVKNGLEACALLGVVTLSCRVLDGQAVFSVHNPGYMPREVQLQIFNRSFSTKDPSRGLGTYSVLLLVESFLDGRVWFESHEEQGTTFYMALPLRAFSAKP